MGHVLVVIMLFVMIPAYGIALLREHGANVKSKRIFASEEQRRDAMNALLQPTKEDIDAVNETFRRRDKETPEQWRDRLLYEEGIAEDFQAIYGYDWKERAVFDANRTLVGCGWSLQGFHNSPIGDRLYLNWREDDAVKALLYSRRGKIPPYRYNYEPYINIIPYSYTDWNFDNGVRWYRRIEENLRRAGADVTMYFKTMKDTYDFGGGPYFVETEFRVTRW